MCISIRLKLPPLQLRSSLCSVWGWGAGGESERERAERYREKEGERGEIIERRSGANGVNILPKPMGILSGQIMVFHGTKISNKERDGNDKY